MLSKLLNKRRNDRGDSTLVTFIIVFPLFFMFLITIIDTSVYFSNRAIVQQAARDAARTTAIFGGAGTNTVMTPLEASYGNPNFVSGCEAPGYGRTVTSPSGGINAIECNLIRRLTQGGAGLINVQIDSVDCGPVRANTVGDSTWCEVRWNYGGVPGSANNFIAAAKGNKAADAKGDSLFRVNTTRVTSESEVGMAGINCKQRNAPTVNAAC